MRSDGAASSENTFDLMAETTPPPLLGTRVPDCTAMSLEDLGQYGDPAVNRLLPPRRAPGPTFDSGI